MSASRSSVDSRTRNDFTISPAISSCTAKMSAAFREMRSPHSCDSVTASVSSALTISVCPRCRTRPVTRARTLSSAATVGGLSASCSYRISSSGAPDVRAAVT